MNISTLLKNVSVHRQILAFYIAHSARECRYPVVAVELQFRARDEAAMSRLALFKLLEVGRAA